jgi:predicted metal-binding membrane protein
MLLGFVPVLGDVADVFWKANLRNLALLERHARPGAAPSRSDYVVVGLALALLAAIALAPVALLVWLLSQRALI